MTRAHALVALGASVLLLAGCTPARQLPAPITPEEAQRQLDEQNVEWWDTMFPGEPMPEIEPVEYLEPGDSGNQVGVCLKARAIEGMTFDDIGWSYSGGDPETDRAVNLALFTCVQQYPSDMSDPGALGMISDAEAAWIADYNENRLVPCLRMLGYYIPVQEMKGRYWSPYFEMVPQPASNAEWNRIDFQCPPSPVGPQFLFRPSVEG